MKILIAEDSRSSLIMLESMLTKWDYDVIAACDGGEAWEKLQEKDELRLAIVDWMMPVMDGDELKMRIDLGRRIVELQTKLQHAHDPIKKLEV